MRCFVAVELAEAARREIARRVDAARRVLPAARWVRPENYHLTLFFLGDVTGSQAERLSAKLTSVLGRERCFELRLGDGGCFPERRPARVAWLGVEPQPALDRVQEAVAGSCLEELGLREERVFRPHLTLARCRPPWSRQAVAEFLRLFPGPFDLSSRVDRIVLMESRTGSSGPIHEVLDRFVLEDV